MLKYAEKIQVFPIKAPAATTADTESAWVALKNVQDLAFIVQWGDLDSDTDTFNVAVKSTTSATSGTTNSNDYALPFKYRLSSVVGTDNWGDITSVTTATGYATVTAAQDNMALLIHVDPAVIPAHDSDATFVYVDIDANAAAATDTNYALSALAIIAPRYPQNENLSSS
jgi:hypothetical protein